MPTRPDVDEVEEKLSAPAAIWTKPWRHSMANVTRLIIILHVAESMQISLKSTSIAHIMPRFWLSVRVWGTSTYSTTTSVSLSWGSQRELDTLRVVQLCMQVRRNPGLTCFPSWVP